MTDEPDTAELENRIDKLESTIEKMMPSRRDALKMGGAALVGGAAMTGTASAGTNQVGTIGDKDASPPQLVDLHSEDINNADTVTTENLVVNNTATGPFGSAPVLESGDTLTIESLHSNTTNQSFVNLYSGSSKDVLGGVVFGGERLDWLYEFSDNTTITKNGGVGVTTYTFGNLNNFEDDSGDRNEADFMPPAKDVIRVEVAQTQITSRSMAAEVILKD